MVTDAVQSLEFGRKACRLCKTVTEWIFAPTVIREVDGESAMFLFLPL